MKRSAWMCTLVLILTGAVNSASAQDGAASSQGGGQANPFALSIAGAAQQGAPQGNLAAAGSGSTTSVGMNGDLFTAAQSEPARPMDRVNFEYAYYDRFRVQDAAGTAPGYDLHRYNLTLEKTLFGGMSSVFLHVPGLDATDNATLRDVDGFGDIGAGFKAILLGNPDSAALLSAGLLVTAPTARDQAIEPNLFAAQPANITGTEIHPTLFQPFISGVVHQGGFFVQNYLGLVVPTDDRVSTLLNNDFTMGYQLYEGNSSRFISSVTPTFGAQALITLSESNGLVVTPAQGVTAAGLSDQVFLRGGAVIGFGERTLLSSNVVVPVVGPRAFSVGATVGVTFFFGGGSQPPPQCASCCPDACEYCVE